MKNLVVCFGLADKPNDWDFRIEYSVDGKRITSIWLGTSLFDGDIRESIARLFAESIYYQLTNSLNEAASQVNKNGSEEDL